MTDISEEAALKALDRLYEENESGLKRLAQMDQEHPMLPTQEQLTKWDEEYFDEGENFDVMMIKAFQAGADQQLEQDAKWLDTCALFSSHLTITPSGDALRQAMRTKPPSLKEQALAELELLRGDANAHGLGFDAPAIRRALEQLND